MRLPLGCGHGGFNPLPSRGTGATSEISAAETASRSFNPLPSRGTGATAPGDGAADLQRVSILSRPVGREQQQYLVTCGAAAQFQSSPVPWDGSNSRRWRSCRRGRSCFNPLPSRGTGATGSRRRSGGCAHSFNPLPSRGTGATGRRASDPGIWTGLNPLPSRGTGATAYVSTPENSGV